jgi:uncharacterized glyoxalase superfamily protein PhnB/DNA-binding XRE family transcriptional regulator
VEQQQVGSQIRQWRERKSWTQEHLAQAAGVAARTVQRAEEGAMSAETLSALAGALDVPVERFRAAKRPPEHWPRMTPAVFYEDTNAAVAFLETAFGFVAREKVSGPDGRIVHAELELHDGLIMLGLAGFDARLQSPQKLGAVTSFVHTFVDDVQTHCAQAQKAGARIVTALQSAHGQQSYRALDPEGHLWSFAEAVDG